MLKCCWQDRVTCEKLNNNKHPASKAGGNTSGSTAGRHPKARIELLLETIW